jgi:hypothetical protein
MRPKPADGVTPRAPTVLTLLAPVALLLSAPAVHAQTRWTVDPRASLAWWQVVPNLRQYRATTCPADPDWKHPHVSGSDSLLGTVNHPVPLVPDTAGAQNEDTVAMPGANPVPATAPDSVPAGYYDGSNLVRNPARLSAYFYRDIVAVLSKPTATIAQRQAAVDSVNGTVIGGLPLCGAGDGLYLVRLPHDSTNNRPLDAATKLKGLPGVGAAAPDLVFSVGPR